MITFVLGVAAGIVATLVVLALVGLAIWGN